ncbi:MAG: hypothetical protein R3Y57_03150 [Erysipelotrichaceae bacterium]
MAIYDFLQVVQDERKGSDASVFNGFLEDYLDTIGEDAPHYSFFKRLFEVNEDSKIIVGYHVGINHETISNQIIRYKDVFKLKNNPLVCPFILYVEENGTQKALLLTDKEFIYVKGLYYTMTEPNGALQDVKNEMIAMCMEDEELVVSVYERIFSERAGSLQREIDRKAFVNYEASKEEALRLSEDMKENAFTRIKEVADEEREALINGYIVKWFLLKKYLYVQYMINKEILLKVHEGNVKKQRNQAKMNADEIKFLSLSDMWRASQSK